MHLRVPVEQGADLSTSDLATKSTIPPAAVLLGLFIGSAIAFFFHTLLTAAPGNAPQPLLIGEILRGLDLPARSGGVIAVVKEPEITPEVTADARRALVQGRQSLGGLDGRVARDAFTRCIELADLPKCHLELGLLLLVTDDGAGYAHLEHYLELNPKDPDSDEIRRILQLVKTSTT